MTLSTAVAMLPHPVSTTTTVDGFELLEVANHSETRLVRQAQIHHRKLGTLDVRRLDGGPVVANTRPRQSRAH